MVENNPFLERIIRLALEEDLGLGDLTTNAVVDPELTGKASLFAREELMLAGLPLFMKVFFEMSPKIRFEKYYEDGDLVPAGAKICNITGLLSPILKAERTALNFLQRMSGIATLTRQYTEKIKPFKVKILDTRKTAPCLRWFDKYSVRVGGGYNHRFGLFDGILIKDNHIAAAGSITRAVESVRENAPHTLKVEVEVEDLDGAEEAFKAGADIILLDNMPPDKIKKAVFLLKGKIMIEASGGITLDTIADVAKTGVDFISVGALTHSARAADFSLEIIPDEGRE